MDASSKTRFHRMNARQRATVIGGVCLALFVILFALAEGVVRVRAWLKHGQAVVRIEDTYRIDEQTGLRVPMPGFTTPRLTINNLGFRGPELPRDKPPGTYRIAFLGGSTTYCAEVSGDDKTWPYLVVEALKLAHPDRRFDYINAGVPGYTTHESLKRFEAEVSALDPDIVVIYHATNDLSGNSRKAAKAQGLSSEAGDRTLTWLSNWSMLAYLVEKNLRVLALQAAVDDPSNKLNADPTALAAPFEDDLRKLVQTVKASGAKVALVSFVTRLRRDQTPEEKKAAAVSALYYMPYMTPDGLIDGFEAYNRTIRKVAKEEGATFVDAAMAVPGDAARFADSVHFKDQGAAAIARVVSAGLPAIIQFKGPSGAMRKR